MCAQKTEREKLAGQTVESFFQGRSLAIADDIVSRIVENAVKKHTTDRVMVREILGSLQSAYEQAEKKQHERAGGPTGSESTAAMDYQMRNWYAVEIHAGRQVETVYITFTDKELEEFNSSSSNKKQYILSEKAAPERREAFTWQGESASEIVGHQIASHAGITRVKINPEKLEMTGDGFIPRKGGEAVRETIAERRENELDRIAARVVGPEQTDETFRYQFAITTENGEKITVSGRFTIEQISHVETAALDPKENDKLYKIVYDLMEQGTATVNGKTGEKGTAELNRVLEQGIASVAPSDIIEGGETRVAASEREKKETTISIALRLNRPVKMKHPEAEKSPETLGGSFTYQNVVFNFTPTEEELKAYNDDPKAFTMVMQAILEDPEQRKAFMEIHQDDNQMTLYIPPVGLMTPKKLKPYLSDGIEINDKMVVRYLVGDYYSTHGESFPSGFTVYGTAKTSSQKDGRDITLPEQKEQMRKTFRFRKQEEPGTSYYMVAVQVGTGTVNLYMSMNAKEAKEFRKMPRQILLQKARAGETYSEDGKMSKAEMTSLTRAIESPATKFSLFPKPGKKEGLQHVALWGMPREVEGQYIEGGETRIAATEKAAKTTNIAIAMETGRIEHYIKIGPNKSERIEFDRFVFSFQPTAEELRVYNENPSKFNMYIRAVLSHPERRKAFLERHRGKTNIYIPADGYAKASYEFWKRYPGGVVIHGNTKENDSRIRLGIMGSMLTSGVTGGFTIKGTASISTSGGTADIVKRMRTSLPMPEITGRKAPQKPKKGGSIEIRTATPYLLSFTSETERITVEIRLTPEEAEKINNKLSSNQQSVYGILEEKLRKHGIIIVRAEGKFIVDGNAAVADYIQRGIEQASLRKKSGEGGTVATRASEPKKRSL
ncbi:hypothetical protein JXA56_00265 [Candidatus Micrarchaeota archaeon]|nr:hypothetical protein [Candidatus Micrarchaeota archaeon]